MHANYRSNSRKQALYLINKLLLKFEILNNVLGMRAKGVLGQLNREINKKFGYEQKFRCPSACKIIKCFGSRRNKGGLKDAHVE